MRWRSLPGKRGWTEPMGAGARAKRTGLTLPRRGGSLTRSRGVAVGGRPGRAPGLPYEAAGVLGRCAASASLACSAASRLAQTKKTTASAPKK